MMIALLTEIASGRDGRAPASVLALSGDVHFSYAARLRLPAGYAPVWQLVCSPFRNPLPKQLRIASGVVLSRPFRVLGRLLARSAKVGARQVRWHIGRGPWFDNMIATVEIDGEGVTVRWLRPLDGGQLEERGRLTMDGWEVAE
jgi:hypothetical protein